MKNLENSLFTLLQEDRRLTLLPFAQRSVNIEDNSQILN